MEDLDQQLFAKQKSKLLPFDFLHFTQSGIWLVQLHLSLFSYENLFFKASNKVQPVKSYCCHQQPGRSVDECCLTRMFRLQHKFLFKVWWLMKNSWFEMITCDHFYLAKIGFVVYPANLVFLLKAFARQKGQLATENSFFSLCRTLEERCFE